MKLQMPVNYFRKALTMLSVIGLVALTGCSTSEDDEIIIDAPQSTFSARSAGDVITLKAKINGKYLSHENGNNMTTNRDNVGTWEKFTLVSTNSSGYYALKAFNNKYVSVQSNDKLKASSTNANSTTSKFRFVTSGGKTGLQCKNGDYICAENKGKDDTVCDRGALGTWEDFTVGDEGGTTNGGGDTPYDALGLDRWKITLPKDQSGNGKADEVYYYKNDNDYSGDDALTDYSDEFFYVNNSGNVIFECPADDDLPKTSSGTDNTRTELREMPYRSDNDDSWDAGGSTVREMSFRVRVLQTSSTRKLAFAQIHDDGVSNWDDLIRIQIQSDDANATSGDNGKIYIMGDMAEGLSSEGVSGESSNDRTIISNYTLGDWMDFRVTYNNDTIRIYLNGSNSAVKTYTGADCPKNYFKAGCYNQSMSSSSSGTGIVEFQSLSVTSNF